MGAKFSKSSKGEKKWDDMKVNGKSLPENFDKTSTLPASFRRRDEEVVMTGTLPRNLNRNQSFSKRFRKSCKNWAAQRGLIDPCKADNQTETQSQVPTKPSSVVLAQEECKDKITDVAQELPEVVITKAQSLDMLVESNSIPTPSSNDDSTKPEKEIVSEIEALSNSGKAEIVIEASSQEIEGSDIEPTKDSASTKTSESKSEEIIKTENTNAEIAEVKCESSPLNETEGNEDQTDPNHMVKETEPVVTETKENETSSDEKETTAGELTDPTDVPLIEKSEIVEAPTMHENQPSEEIVPQVNGVVEQTTEKEIEKDTEKENLAELKQEVIDTESVPQAELQTEILTKGVEEINTVSEKTTIEAIETATEIVEEEKVEKGEDLSTLEIVENNSEIDTNASTLIQEQTTAEEVTMESVISEEQVVNETEVACVIDANEKESEITEKDKVQENGATSEEKITDEKIIKEDMEKDEKIEDGKDDEIQLPEADHAEPLTITKDDSPTLEKTSCIESEQEITNEIENQTSIPADEVTEVAENIEVTDRNSDNLVDKEEESHDNVITDDNKSQEVMEEDKNDLNISEDNCNEQDNRLEESIVEQEKLGTVEISSENIQGDRTMENSVNNILTNTASESTSETENINLEKIESEEQVSEEIKEKESAAPPNEAISSSDGIWKCQWDIPCLATKVDEEAAMTMQAPEMTNEELTEKSENQQSENPNEEELSTMNEALDSSNTDIEPTDVKIESVTENESRAEIQEEPHGSMVAHMVAPYEPEDEKETEAVNDELDSTTKFEGESNISLPELEEVEMKTENLDMENAEPNSLESLDDEKSSSEKAINNENKHVETAMKDILTDIVDNIASKSEMTSLENVRDASADDLISEGGSDGCVSTDEGIAASDDDDKDSCKSDELKKDNAKENATSEIENLITEIDQHP